MPLICDRAICIRRVEWSETSQILTLLTAGHGVIRGVARGAHRATKAGASKFDGGVDLLDEGDALFTDRTDRDLNTLAEWKLLAGHRGVRGTLRSLYLGLYLAEIVGQLFETADPQPDLFARFATTLDALPTPALEEHALAMSLDATAIAGVLPELDRCLVCDRTVGADRVAFFSTERGGAICKRCERDVPDRIAIDPRTLALASSVARLPRARDGSVTSLPRLDRAAVDPIHTLMSRHIEHVVGRASRLAWRIVGAGALAPRPGRTQAVSAASPETDWPDDLDVIGDRTTIAAR